MRDLKRKFCGRISPPCLKTARMVSSPVLLLEVEWCAGCGDEPLFKTSSNSCIDLRRITITNTFIYIGEVIREVSVTNSVLAYGCADAS